MSDADRVETVFRWSRLAQVGLALLILTAIATQFRAGFTQLPDFQPVNFLSFFTIQSNLVAAVVLLFGRTDALRGAATLYLSITGIVYAVLLSGLERTLQTPIPWVNFVLHRLSPVALVIGWLVEPPRRRLRSRTALLWLVYPGLYLAYALLRGAQVGWYPYPFLDPRRSGAGSVAAVCAVIAVGASVWAWVILWVGNRRARSCGPTPG
jgi:hypothetical protein